VAATSVSSRLAISRRKLSSSDWGRQRWPLLSQRAAVGALNQNKERTMFVQSDIAQSNDQGRVLREVARVIGRGVLFPVCETCASLSAVHDLAALSEGNLSCSGKRRLARHLSRCQACTVVLASLVKDADAQRLTGGQAWREGSPRLACGSEHPGSASQQRPGLGTDDRPGIRARPTPGATRAILTE
jgi:hypothetical protein